MTKLKIIIIILIILWIVGYIFYNKICLPPVIDDDHSLYAIFKGDKKAYNAYLEAGKKRIGEIWEEEKRGKRLPSVSPSHVSSY